MKCKICKYLKNDYGEFICKLTNKTVYLTDSCERWKRAKNDD